MCESEESLPVCRKTRRMANHVFKDAVSRLLCVDIKNYLKSAAFIRYIVI
jgi:hypothetical protein